MTDLLEKHRHLAARHEAMIEMGADAVGLPIERILSPTRALIGGCEVILAGTNNYMGLTFDPDCIAAGKQALEDYGAGTTGSRIANGTYGIHRRLEREIADFLGRKHCIVFTTGYQANLGVIAGLAGPNDTIFIDADSHSSIYEGCVLSGARLVRFRHNDAGDLDRRLSRLGNETGGRLVILEGLYSMLGDRAPLAEFVGVKRRHGFCLLVDEAHSFGVLGERGRGLAEEAALEGEVDCVVGTFSKSVGSVGGFGAGDHPLFETLRYAMRAYMFSASQTPSSVAAATAAIGKLKAGGERRERLWRNATRLHAGLTGLGLDVVSPEASPIIAVRRSGEANAIAIWNRLLEAGVYVNIALPPGTPGRMCLLRCSVSAAHTDKEIDTIVERFGKTMTSREQAMTTPAPAEID